MKETIDNLDFIKIKDCSVKNSIKRMRGQTDNRILAKDTSFKGLLSKIDNS